MGKKSRRKRTDKWAHIDTRKEYDLSEPRLWVCGGCDEARYCDEACQRAHWPDHRPECYETLKCRIHTQVSEGATKPEMLQEFGELLDVFGDYVQ